MPITKRIVYINLQNVESEVAKIIKEEEYSRVIEAQIDDSKTILTLWFERDYSKKHSTYVKQVSKKKYSDLSTFFEQNPRQCGSKVTRVIAMPNFWLVFFEK